MKLKGRNKISPEFSMSSMTDIVFLLLVFFMLTANAPSVLDLVLPKAAGKATSAQSVSVTIDKALDYFVNREPIRKEQLEIALKKALAGQENPTILLRAEESVALKEAVTVMDIARRNQYKIILAVQSQ